MNRDRIRPLDVSCPHCGADPGRRCKGRSHLAANASHRARIHKAKEQEGEPPVS